MARPARSAGGSGQALGSSGQALGSSGQALGSSGQALGSSGQAIARAWPGAELCVTSGLGHNQLLTAPEVVARTAEFLRVLAPSAELEVGRSAS